MYADGTCAYYQYDPANGTMITLYDGEAQYGLEISYIFNFGVRSTFRVREFTAGSAPADGQRQYGSAFHAYRDGVRQTSYRFYGPDHTRDTADDTITSYILD